MVAQYEKFAETKLVAAKVMFGTIFIASAALLGTELIAR
jgi:hypothetical protein